MDSMFLNATEFNADITAWNTSSLTSSAQMFSGANAFSVACVNITTTGSDGPPDEWDCYVALPLDDDILEDAVEQCLILSPILGECAWSADVNPYGPMREWNVSLVTDFSGLFSGVFNGNISSWDTSSAKTMSNMFQNARDFNADISLWDVSQVRVWMACLMAPIRSTKTSRYGTSLLLLIWIKCLETQFHLMQMSRLGAC